MAANYADVIFGRLNHASLTDLVGDRITPVKPKEEPTGNYACFWRENSEHALNTDGAESHSWMSVRFEAVGTTQAEAEAIRKAAYDRLHGWRDLTVGVQVCAAQGDADETLLDDGRHVNGQSFRLRFKPV